MGRVEKSIEIRAPPEKVWEMLAFDRIQEWDEGYGEGLGERVEYTSEHECNGSYDLWEKLS